jgi:hypothetical protein
MSLIPQRVAPKRSPLPVPFVAEIKPRSGHNALACLRPQAHRNYKQKQAQNWHFHKSHLDTLHGDTHPFHGGVIRKAFVSGFPGNDEQAV